MVSALGIVFTMWGMDFGYLDPQRGGPASTDHDSYRGLKALNQNLRQDAAVSQIRSPAQVPIYGDRSKRVGF